MRRQDKTLRKRELEEAHNALRVMRKMERELEGMPFRHWSAAQKEDYLRVSYLCEREAFRGTPLRLAVVFLFSLIGAGCSLAAVILA